VAWIGIAVTFGVIVIYRILISYKEEDAFFMNAAEIRNTLDHIRDVNRMAVLFGAASAISLVLIVAGWLLHWL
jgi:hypothetical protein